MILRDFRTGIAKPGNEFEAELDRRLNDYFRDLKTIINEGIRADQNLSGTITTVTFPAVADTETAVAHGLSRVPNGYIILGADRACQIYNTTVSDSTNVYLKSSVADAVVKVLIL